jgi:LPXTG-site transpeptidase (sortase) family protein
MIKKSQMKFFLYFVVVFILFFILLYSAGLVPETMKKEEGDSLRTLWDKAQSEAINKQRQQGIIDNTAIKPERIVIDKIGVDSVVANPNTDNVATLDEYLKQGAVRYPGSGTLGFGNMFIFAHSTGLRVVNNQAYKTFNGLKDLKAGDIIKIYGNSKLYIYEVKLVKLVDEKEALVTFDLDQNRLTLSTCNTFGAKSERYVVEADYLY